MLIRIQSFSDLITNSSSEVFVIRGKNKQKVSDLLHELYELLGRDIDEDMCFDSASRNGYDKYLQHYIKKGDLIIEGVNDNSIPDAISGFIENIDSLIKNVSVEREFIG